MGLRHIKEIYYGKKNTLLNTAILLKSQIMGIYFLRLMKYFILMTQMANYYGKNQDLKRSTLIIVMEHS